MIDRPVQVWIGFDPREAAAFAVARESVRRNVPRQWRVHGLVLSKLKECGLYTRPMERWIGRRVGAGGKEYVSTEEAWWDVISEAPMSTEHANARFLVPHLARWGWAVFMDGDVLVKADLAALLASLDPEMAVYCVKHKFEPPVGVKMDGQTQTRYSRKNWSSVIVFNCDHAANDVLTPDLVNMLPGRDLHRLCWLEDELIGELSPEWNFLVGHTDPAIVPKCIHWTDGVPDMRGFENAPFADEWRKHRDDWAFGANVFPGW